MKKRSEKQQDLDNLKNELAKVSTVILSTFQGITVDNDNKLRRAVQQAGGTYKVVKNTLAERAAAGTPNEALLKDLEGHQFNRLHDHRSRFPGKSIDKNCQGRARISIPGGNRRRTRSFDRGDPATGIAAVQGRIAQQDHVSARSAGNADCFGAGSSQPQSGHYHNPAEAVKANKFGSKVAPVETAQ